MKVCNRCSQEHDGLDGDNLCRECMDLDDAPKGSPKRKAARLSRKVRDSIADSLGLKKVRGALGGTYYE